MDRKIRVGAVSYLNTKPLIYGIQHAAVAEEIELTTGYPSQIADMLLRDEIDIGLVPVAMIPAMRAYYINTDFCIGSDGAVSSVCIYSEVPVEEIRTLLLDYQSRTSVVLAEILLKKYWNVNPQLKDAGTDFIQEIAGTTAAVIIGDRALEQNSKSKYVYDLGEAWKQLTGLPFVFAAWISNKPLDPQWVQRFNLANAYGIENIPAVIEIEAGSPFDLHAYYTKYLNYDLNAEKKEALALFLKWEGEVARGATDNIAQIAAWHND